MDDALREAFLQSVEKRFRFLVDEFGCSVTRRDYDEPDTGPAPRTEITYRNRYANVIVEQYRPDPPDGSLCARLRRWWTQDNGVDVRLAQLVYGGPTPLSSDVEPPRPFSLGRLMHATGGTWSGRGWRGIPGTVRALEVAVADLAVNVRLHARPVLRGDPQVFAEVDRLSREWEAANRDPENRPAGLWPRIKHACCHYSRGRRPAPAFVPAPRAQGLAFAGDMDADQPDADPGLACHLWTPPAESHPDDAVPLHFAVRNIGYRPLTLPPRLDLGTQVRLYSRTAGGETEVTPAASELPCPQRESVVLPSDYLWGRVLPVARSALSQPVAPGGACGPAESRVFARLELAREDESLGIDGWVGRLQSADACLPASEGPATGGEGEHPEGGLALEVWPSGRSFTMGDTVIVAVLARNVSERERSFCYWMGFTHVNLYLRTPEGRNVGLFSWGVSYGPPSRSDFVTLAPGYLWGHLWRIPLPVLAQVWQGAQGASCRYLALTSDSDQPGRAWEQPPSERFGSFGPGEYALYATFSLGAPRYRGEEFGIDGWVGRLRSAEVPLTITPTPA